MKAPKVVKFDSDWQKYKGHIYSEQWDILYEEKEGNYWKRKSIMYCTEWKGMSDEVKQQFLLDFAEKEIEIIKIQYQ